MSGLVINSGMRRPSKTKGMEVILDADAHGLRLQLIDLLHRHPPHNWSATLLAAVVAIIAVEATQHASDKIGGRPHLRLV